MMKCERCNGEVQPEVMPLYRFTESGLDNVYLTNVNTTFCENCGARGLFLPQLKILHQTIARAITLQPFLLNGDELRFLRKQLRMKARQWAALLRVDVATFSRWENNERVIGSQSDALIRFLYCVLANEKFGSKIPENLAERVAAVNEKSHKVPCIKINSQNPEIFSYEHLEEKEEAVFNAASFDLISNVFTKWATKEQEPCNKQYAEQEYFNNALITA